MRREPPENRDRDSRNSRLPSLSGNSTRDWCLWQLIQVLLEIARSSSCGDDKNKEVKEDNNEERGFPQSGK